MCLQCGHQVICHENHGVGPTCLYMSVKQGTSHWEQPLTTWACMGKKLHLSTHYMKPYFSPRGIEVNFDNPSFHSCQGTHRKCISHCMDLLDSPALKYSLITICMDNWMYGQAPMQGSENGAINTSPLSPGFITLF